MQCIQDETLKNNNKTKKKQNEHSDSKWNFIEWNLCDKFLFAASTKTYGNWKASNGKSDRHSNFITIKFFFFDKYISEINIEIR